MAAKRTILWFRKGLRVHDNPALVKACEGASAVQPVFVLDPWFIKPERVGANRLRFLLESLTDLDASLRARGSSLLVLHGDPARVIPAALEAWRCDRLCYEFDTEPYAQKRDASVNEAARALGVEVHAPVAHTLWDLDRLLAKCPRFAQYLIWPLPRDAVGADRHVYLKPRIQMVTEDFDNLSLGAQRRRRIVGQFD